MALTPSQRRAMEAAQKALRNLPASQRLAILKQQFGSRTPPKSKLRSTTTGRSTKRTDLGDLIGLLAGKDSRALTRDLISLARGRGASAFLRTLLGSMGTAGKVAQSLIQAKDITSPSIPKSAVEDAIALLKGAGFEVRLPEKPETRPSLAPQPNTGEPAKPKTGQPEPPTVQPSEVQGPMPETGAFPGGLYVPMERVQSSNVYAIGYNGATQTMRVQYLGTAINAAGISGAGHAGKKRVRGAKGKTVTGKRYGGGPTYDYFGVPEKVFNKIRNAGSKGKAIWDGLRIRGTVYGHRYDYRLTAASVADVIDMNTGKRVAKVTYVPRKATGPGGFQARTMLQGVGPAAREYRSLLRSQRGRRK